MVLTVHRLAREERGVYAVHDYKTGGMMAQEYADRDRQLALYSIFVKQNFKEAKEVKLVWHYVAFGEDVISSRTDQQLKELKVGIITLIKDIERAEKENDFPAKETLCEWCSFWQYCPKKKHQYKIEKLPANKYMRESGVKLAAKYAELSRKISNINAEQKEKKSTLEEEKKLVEQAIIKYANEHELDTLNGGDYMVAVHKETGCAFPTRSSNPEAYGALEDLLKGTKYWSLVSDISQRKLEEFLAGKQIGNDLKSKILSIAPVEVSVHLSLRKSKK